MVITISRDYAAFGRTVAAGLSKQLGIPFYDMDFIKKTAEESGYSEEDIVNQGEDMSRGSRFLNSFLNNSVTYSSSFDGIFAAQSKVILELSQSPCIIVGRCSDYVLREAGIESFNVFLYADMEIRIERTKELGHADEADIKKYIEKRDDRRHTYYKQYTKSEMGDYKNYDISLNTGTIGVDTCVDVLAQIIKGKYPDVNWEE
jgi:cytidylate kinase